MRTHTKAHLALFTAQVIYSVSFVIIKIITKDYMGPFALVLLRVMTAMPLYWLLGMLFVKEKTDKKDLPKLLMLSLFGVMINQSFFVKGLSLTSPISAAILMITSPIVVLIMGFFIVREKITWQRAIGIPLGFGGAALLMLSSGINAGGKEDNLLGDLMIFINASSWALYLVLVKPLMQKYNTITILKWMFTFGFLGLLPLCFNEFSQVQWHTFSPKIWFYTSFVVIGTTFLAYLLNVYALKDLSSSVVAAYIYLQPVLTAVLAISTGNDEISLTKIISALMIFVGVYFVSRKQKELIMD